MLSVDEALQLVVDHVTAPTPVKVSLGDAAGLVLAESTASDIDSPPHDKSIVDGYAVVSSDLTRPGVTLTLLEEVVAGSVPTKAVATGTATRIMTGAPLPRGADAVVMIEQTKMDGETVVIQKAEVRRGQNIMPRASAIARGDMLLQPGTMLRPIEIALLAEVGKAEVVAFRRPTLAAIATGNEIVHVDQIPAAGQIRNSNGPMLAALARQAGALSTEPSVARDEKDDLRRAITQGLSCDVLLLSGGVSAGVLDLVPSVLAELGVRQVFHKVNLKPGKPLWFGYADRDGRRTLVFGLPGNPVSSLVCFELFVRPAIQKMRGLPPAGLWPQKAKLTSDHQQRGDRPTYWPAAVCEKEVKPLAWKGSGDLRTLADANCLALFPAGDWMFRAGEEVEVLLFAES